MKNAHETWNWNSPEQQWAKENWNNVHQTHGSCERHAWAQRMLHSGVFKHSCVENHLQAINAQQTRTKWIPSESPCDASHWLWQTPPHPSWTHSPQVPARCTSAHCVTRWHSGCQEQMHLLWATGTCLAGWLLGPRFKLAASVFDASYWNSPW